MKRCLLFLACALVLVGCKKIKTNNDPFVDDSDTTIDESILGYQDLSEKEPANCLYCEQSWHL